jgi:hypothetical protein
VNLHATVAVCFSVAALCGSALLALRWTLSSRADERRARTEAHDEKLASVESDAAKLAERVRVLEWRSSQK